MSRFTYVTALHGNEPLPTLALASVGQAQLVGNAPALAQNKRFLEQDMNASFGTDGNSKEEVLARRLLEQIPADATVVDFHTFQAPSPPFAILVDPSLLDLAVATGIPNIVLMRFNPKAGRALLNHRRGISVETGQNSDPQSFHRALHVRARLEGLEKTTKAAPRLFEVYDTIKQPGIYHNFQEYQEGEGMNAERFYPILTGQKEYTIIGLKARIITEKDLQ